DDRVRSELLDHGERRRGVGQIDDERVDTQTGQLTPDPRSRMQRLDRNEALDANLVVVLTANEVVSDRDVVTTFGEMQRGRPAEVPVAAKDQDPHAGLLHPRTFVRRWLGRSAGSG